MGPKSAGGGGGRACAYWTEQVNGCLHFYPFIHFILQTEGPQKGSTSPQNEESFLKSPVDHSTSGEHAPEPSETQLSVGTQSTFSLLLRILSSFQKLHLYPAFLPLWNPGGLHGAANLSRHGPALDALSFSKGPQPMPYNHFLRCNVAIVISENFY